MKQARAEHVVECPSCGRSWPTSTTFCGGCGEKLEAAPSAAPSDPEPTAAAGPAAAATAATSAPPPVATAAAHRVPPAGLQGYAEPDVQGGLSQFLVGNADVAVVQTLGAWAQVQIGDKTVWIDGRELVPPTAPRAVTAPTPAAAAAPNGWSVISVLAGVGVIVGSVLDWFSSSSSVNGFDVPLPYLFDYTTLDEDPKVGYFLIALGVVAILTSFSAATVWVRRGAGLLSLAAAVLFCVQVQESIGSLSSVNFSDIIGAGPWVVGASGLALVVVPGPKRVRQPTTSSEPSATMPTW